MKKKEETNKEKLIEEILSEDDMKFIFSFLSGMMVEKIFKIFEVEEKEGEKHGKGKSKVKRKQDNK